MGYSDGLKAIAVEIVHRNNGVIDVATLEAVRIALDAPNLPKMTIYRWVQSHEDNKNNLESLSVVTAKKQVARIAAQQAIEQAQEALDKMCEDAARRFIEHATKKSVIERATASQAMTSAGIAIDKMRLLRGLPTEIIGILPDLVQAISNAGLKPSDVFQEMLNSLREVRHADSA